MYILPFRNSTIKTTLTLFLVCCPFFLFAQESSLDPSVSNSYQQEDNLSELQKQARSYRLQGLELQRLGDTDRALSFYQKAVELDPAYAVAYNDIGIIYEAKGLIDQAEEFYLKAINIDPGCLSAYANLALVYEGKRNLDQAVFYWRKRADLGSPGELWTERARQRLKDIYLVSSENPLEEARQQEAPKYHGSPLFYKSILKSDNKGLAKIYFENAKLKLKDGDELSALKIAIDANLLDPANTEIEEFVERTQTRLLSR